jgi:hypothetical protein
MHAYHTLDCVHERPTKFVRYVMADCRSWILHGTVHRFYMKDFLFRRLCEKSDE